MIGVLVWNEEKGFSGMAWQGWNVLLPSLPSHLLDHGAFPAPVNNEGDTPEDLVDDDVIRELITEAIERQGTAISPNLMLLDI